MYADFVCNSVLTQTFNMIVVTTYSTHNNIIITEYRFSFYLRTLINDPDKIRAILKGLIMRLINYTLLQHNLTIPIYDR